MHDEKMTMSPKKNEGAPLKKAILVSTVMNACAFYLSAKETVCSWALNVSLGF